MDIEWAVRSVASPRCGDRQRSENQDNYLVIDAEGIVRHLQHETPWQMNHPCWQRGAWRFAVIDGMGGHARARDMAEALAQALSTLPPMRSEAELAAALEGIHFQLQQRFRTTVPQPGATLTLLEQPACGPAMLFHAGDSRFMEVGEREVELLSVDHNPATWQALQGGYDARQWREAMLDGTRRSLSQAIGLGSAMRTGVFEAQLYALTPANLPPWLAPLADRRCIELHPGTSYLLATDGLWNYRRPQTLLQQLPELCHGVVRPPGTPESTADAILAAHRHASASEPWCDNTTFILFRRPGTLS